MTNITLSIEDSTYKKMKEHSEIKWSEFVRKAINKRIAQLESIPEDKEEALFTYLASEKSLAKDWMNKYDERWNEL